MSDRLTEIEERTKADSDCDWTNDLDCVTDRLWLISRLRALEAQAAADSVLVEAASQYGKAEKAAVDSLFEAQPVSVTRALRMEAGVAYRRLVAALAALDGERKEGE